MSRAIVTTSTCKIYYWYFWSEISLKGVDKKSLLTQHVCASRAWFIGTNNNNTCYHDLRNNQGYHEYGNNHVYHKHGNNYMVTMTLVITNKK